MQVIARHAASEPSAEAQRASEQILLALPLLMRFLRAQMRSRRGSELSIPQFRALIFVAHFPGSGISALANHLGSSTPAASRLVKSLVQRRMLVCRRRRDDLRSATLRLTPRGAACFRVAYRGAREALAGRIDRLSPAALAGISTAMGQLRELLAEDQPSGATHV